MSGPRKPRKRQTRKAPLSRSWIKPSRTTPKASNPARKVREFARAYGSKVRCEWVRSLPCCVPGCAAGPSENAHVIGGGMGRKASANLIAPMCSGHHRWLHQYGTLEFMAMYGVHLVTAARECDALWQAHCQEAA